jgi:hypothetical protein
MRDEIIRSLETIEDQVKQELLNVKPYRAILAVDQAIAEISEVEEIVGALNGIRKQVVEHLHDVREYRALLAVQKSIADISEVLGILEESSLKRAAGNGAAVAQSAAAVPNAKSFGGSASLAAMAPAPSASQATVGLTEMQEQAATPAGAPVEFVRGRAVHDGDPVSYPVTQAVEHPASPAAARAEQTPTPPSIDGPAETTAIQAVHDGRSESQPAADSTEHQPSVTTAIALDWAQALEQASEPATESHKTDADPVIHEDVAAKTEDVEIARVA